MLKLKHVTHLLAVARGYLDDAVVWAEAVQLHLRAHSIAVGGERLVNDS